jgi:rod shape-determining protein MreC
VARPTYINPRPFVYLAFGLVVWWLAPGFVRALFKDAFYEFQAPLVLTQSQLQDIQTYWAVYAGTPKHDMITFNRDLLRVNANLTSQNNQLQRLLRENNRRVERLLAVPSRPEYKSIIARVARRDINTWWQRLILRRGREDGVRIGSPVVVGTGVVGRVAKVHATTCEVQLVSDPDFRIAASVDGDERTAIYQGAPNVPFVLPQGVVTHLPSDYTYTPGEGAQVSVFTSGAGGVFPGGLLIGIVVGELSATSDGMFFEGRVRLHTQLTSLEEVAILIPLKPGPTLLE